MSAFLGPIHEWLYQQIKIIEDRERKLVKNFSEVYSQAELAEIVEPLRSEYGNLKEDRPLSQLISGNNIHPWLEAAIVSAQSREAALVSDLQDKFNDQELLEEVYRNQARNIAGQLKTETEMDLKEVFKVLNDYFLERMPCDRLSESTESENKIIWEHQARLHQEFWEDAGVDPELMHLLYSDWIENFVKELNSEIKYERIVNQDHYLDIFIEESS
ncbi:MAG: hypothetical protein ABR596_05270 [Halarsenatibacteraceae bacterium]